MVLRISDTVPFVVPARATPDETRLRLTIHDLERDSGLARRTIHYYTRRGLLPRPIGAGRRAAYGEQHVLRLRLIRVLKRGGLRLDRIAATLAVMSLRQMRCLADLSSDLDCHDPHALAAWLGAAGDVSTGLPTAPGRPRSETLAPTRAPCDSQWVRHRVCDGLEIHHCPDSGEEFEGRVNELRRLAQRLFAGRG